MNQEAARHERDNPKRRPGGWGAALGFALVLAGGLLLLIVLAVLARGPSWLPVYGAEIEGLPTLTGRAAPALALAPTEVAVILPTPLTEDYFSSAATAPQSGFGSAALLPESPADPGQADGIEPAAAPPTDRSPRLEIPAIGVDAPILPVDLIELEEEGRRYSQWQVPNDYAVGWHAASAAFGSPGNTVLNGHNNVHGAVFRDLVEVELGDEVIVHKDGQSYRYQVAHRQVVEEEGQPLEARLDNARWMLPTSDERLTIISCWPYIGNTHRVIVVAAPVESR